MSRQPSKQEEKAELLAIMGSEKRLQILALLLDREMSVSELMTMVDLSQSALRSILQGCAKVTL